MNWWNRLVAYLRMRIAQRHYESGVSFDFSQPDYPPEFPVWHGWIGQRHHLETERNARWNEYRSLCGRSK